jgi:hypothetical protein
MASKKKCRHCGEYGNPEDGVKVPLGWFCSMDHVIAHSNEKRMKTKQIEQKKKTKEFKKETARMKRDFYDNDIKTRKDAAKKACHEYIRLRDKGKPCICCGKPLGDDYHAGHYIPDGNHSFTRYHEDNIHGQRVDCNFFKGGDSGDYKENLIKKIGIERHQFLMDNKNVIVKRTAQDYAEIEQYFRDKIKSMNKLLNSKI